MVSEQWRKRLRIGGQVLLGILIVAYLLVMLADLGSLRSNISAMAGDIRSLQSNVDSIQSDVSSIQDTVNSIEQDLQDITTDDQPEAGRSVATRQENRRHVPGLAAWHGHRNRKFARKTSRRPAGEPQPVWFRDLANGN